MQPIKLGSILFTLVDPHRGHEVAYNRWYERDHFYAGCMVGPGILSGRRWVAPTAYKALRQPSGHAGSYLALYWIDAAHSKEWGMWAGKEVHELHAAGRMFEHRDHVHTRMYRYEGGAFRDEHGVPPELALDHPFKGLVAYLGTGEPPVVEHPSVAMTLRFSPIPVPDSAPADIPRPEPGGYAMLAFLDDDPAEVWSQAFLPDGTTLAAPFIPTVPGTDTYTDDLWI